MAEPRLGQPPAQCLHRRLMRDLAERDEDARSGQRRDRGFEERTAGAAFLWRRLVLRRHAPNRVDDDRAVQRHPVVGPGLVAPPGPPEYLERRIELIDQTSTR